MIERVYLKEHLSFDEVELTFNEVELNLENLKTITAEVLFLTA